MRPHATRLLARAALGGSVASVALVALALAPAQAATYTSTGERCTIVGTSGPDRIVGGPGRDVICGLGGNDVIDGRGGNDVIDAGSGNDTVWGGGGRDRVLGGTGKDRIIGGSGNDRLFGGAGSDRIIGGTGNDTVTAGTGNDTVLGGSGADEITGGAGNDDLAGGTGGDDLSGGTGNDDIDGNAGDDELSGGSGADDLDGGTGFNVCDSPRNPGDEQIRCAEDTSPAKVTVLNLSSSTVDVSQQAKRIRVRARVVDDTGVKRVQIGNMATLVKGTRRDGVWEAYIQVPRFIAPGVRTLDVAMTDRVGRSSDHAFTYTVRNSVVDQQMPVVAGITLSATAVDVRTAGKKVTATVRITDDLAGAASVNYCLQAPPVKASDPYGIAQGSACHPMERISGTAKDSRWRATVTVPRGAVSGVWNASVQLHSAADRSLFAFWLGPDAYQRVATDVGGYDYQRLPAGSRLTVTGAAADRTPPRLTKLSLSRTEVNVAQGAVRVDVEIAGKDAVGITSVGADIGGHPGWPGQVDQAQYLDLASSWTFTRVSGTAKDGVWRASLVIPGGAPTGRYHVRAYLDDGTHFASWTSDESQWGIEENGHLDATLAPGGATLTVRNDS